jgi:hypothetical protein
MPERSNASRYMPDRVSLAGLGTGAALIGGAIVLGALAAFAAVHLGNDGATPHQAAQPGRPPAPAARVELQPTPGRDIIAFRADKERALESYGWVDREHGVARIPIERAMALLANQSGERAKAP